jgi:hypothetical protein
MIRACLSIAVSRPEGNLAALPGAAAAARGVAAWARAAGFDRVETVTDDGPDRRPAAAVTAAGLRLVLATMLRGPVDHLVVHFAGHGFHDEFDDPLLPLTRWPSGPAEAIDLRRFVRLLTFQPVRRVSLMIDACRSGRPESQSRLQGSGILERSSVDGMPPAARHDLFEDRFLALRAGRDAFTTRDPSGGPPCSLFTSVLLKTLHGDYAEAVETRGAARAVTSAGICRSISARRRRPAG